MWTHQEFINAHCFWWYYLFLAVPNFLFYSCMLAYYPIQSLCLHKILSRYTEISLWQKVGVKIEVNSNPIVLYLNSDCLLNFFYLQRSSCVLFLWWLDLSRSFSSSSQLLRDFTALNNLVSTANFCHLFIIHSFLRLFIYFNLSVQQPETRMNWQELYS